ncbi:MAG: hypothetical protein RR585_13685 [Coprobacillus sp.]
MKRKLKYKRVIMVSIIFVFIIIIVIYMYMNRRHDYEYTGAIQTYTASYRQDDKVYTFDLKAFEKAGIQYVSLNDMYNMVVILDKNTKVYLNYNQHVMTYELTNQTYLFDYGHDKIVYNNKCIEFNNKDEHIYVSHKNIYISVFLTEKLLLNNEKKLTFENKNAIIQ